jgi:hypothetical protein
LLKAPSVRIFFRSIARPGRSTTPNAPPMAKSQIKAGGPTRGRKRVRKIGMGSGKYHTAKQKARKG